MIPFLEDWKCLVSPGFWQTPALELLSQCGFKLGCPLPTHPLENLGEEAGIQRAGASGCQTQTELEKMQISEA